MERDIESYMKQEVERMGGRFLKWVSPGNAGVPDRIAIFPGGRVWFVELKDTGGKIGVLQLWWNNQLRHLGCNACIVQGREEAEQWIRDRREEVMPHEVHTT